MEKNNSKIHNSIIILVSSWEKGFTCSMLSSDTKFDMNSKDYELCNTIAKGMCYAANQNPDKIFKLGLKALRFENKKTKLSYLTLDLYNSDSGMGAGSNVIDFLQYLRIKRRKEKN